MSQAYPELAPYVRELKSRLGVQAVVVFGSRARGDDLPTSDYDLVVVSTGLRGLDRLERRDRLYGIWDDVGPDADADIFGLTPEELHGLGSPMLWDALEEGRVIVDDGTWRAAKAEFDRRKAAGLITPIEGGWRIRP